jgi:hypothetical protein
MQYKPKLKSNKGINYEYWSAKHEKMLLAGWSLYKITEESTRQWSQTFLNYSTSSHHHAKKYLDKLRIENNYARIICGYNKNRQRIKMYSIIYKSK